MQFAQAFLFELSLRDARNWDFLFVYHDLNYCNLKRIRQN